MTDLLDAVPVLVVPFITCLVIAALHCYMGLHVIRRGIIFVDLALAQCAAMGAAVALFLIPIVWPEHLQPGGHVKLNMTSEAVMAEELDLEESESSLDAFSDQGAQSMTGPDDGVHGRFAYGMSLLFALLGAVLLSFGRFKDERIPHEAIIGIIFVVCASLSVLILSKAPHGHEKMEAMLIGSILFSSWSQLVRMLLLYIALGAIHLVFAKKFIAISQDVKAAEKTGMRVKLWDCLFFATFALMVTQSVGIAGVLVVFSYLIIPAACGILFAQGFGVQLAIAWFVALATTVAGLCVSALWDMPTGASLVSCFGGALAVCILLRMIVRGAHPAVS